MIVVGLRASGRASERGRVHAGERASGRARLILTVRVKAQQGYTVRAGGTVIGRRGLVLTVRVTAGPVTRVTACYKTSVTQSEAKVKASPYINQRVTRERERDRYIIVIVVTELQAFWSEKTGHSDLVGKVNNTVVSI